MEVLNGMAFTQNRILFTGLHAAGIMGGLS